MQSNQGNKMAIFGENAMVHISTNSACFLLQKYLLESPFKHLSNDILLIEIGPEGAMLGTLQWSPPDDPCPRVAFSGYFSYQSLQICIDICTTVYLYMLGIFSAPQNASIGPQRRGPGRCRIYLPYLDAKKRPKSAQIVAQKAPR